MSFQGSFQLKSFYDSVTYAHGQDTHGHKEQALWNESRAAASSSSYSHQHTHMGKTTAQPESTMEATGATWDTTVCRSQGACSEEMGRMWNVLIKAEALGTRGAQGREN